MPVVVEENDPLFKLALAVMAQTISKQNDVMMFVASHLANTSPTPAYDRPAPVIIMGPRPLPVTEGGGGGGGSKGGGPDADKGGPGFIEKLFGKAVSAIAVIFGPVIALANILNAATSGFGTFIKVMSLMSNIIGTLLLPFFVVLGAAMLTASDILMAKLKPALGEFYEFVVNYLRPAALDLLEQFEDLAEAIGKVLSWIGRNKDHAETVSDLDSDTHTLMTNPTSMFTGWFKALTGDEKEGTKWANEQAQKSAKLWQWITGDEDERVKLLASGHAFDAAAAAGGEETPRARRRRMVEEAMGSSGGGDTRSAFDRNMKVFIESFAKSIGPQASYSSISDANKQIQLAGLNQDPIDAKILKAQLDALEALRGVDRNTARRAAGRFTAEEEARGVGDFSGSIGTGGGDYDGGDF